MVEFAFRQIAGWIIGIIVILLIVYFTYLYISGPDAVSSQYFTLWNKTVFKP